MENSSVIGKETESGSQMYGSQNFPSPPKKKAEFYLDSQNTFVTENKG